MRQRLDRVDPSALRRALPMLFALGRGAGSCCSPNTCVRTPSAGSGRYRGVFLHQGALLVLLRDPAAAPDEGMRRYYHQMLVGALVSPDHRRVLLPSGPKFIRREDGERKNDRELNAAKRYLPCFRREHPKLPVLVLGDASMVHLLREQRMNFLLVAKEGNCRHLFQHLTRGSRCAVISSKL